MRPQFGDTGNGTPVPWFFLVSSPSAPKRAGRGSEAIAEAERALALERQLGLRNAYLPFIFARIYALANKPDEAIDQLEETLRRRDFISREWLRIDSTFAPLRTNPRFQRLVSSSGSAKE